MKAFLATLKGKIIVGILGVVVVTGTVVAAVALSGPEDYRSIKVDELSGQTIIIDEKNNEMDAYKGMNLKAGSTIEVKDGANMTLLMDSDKYMFADEGTKFKVEASGDSKKATTKTKIILIEGSVLCRLDSKLSDDEIFEVETPNSVMSVRGTIFRMSTYKDENGEDNTVVDVLEGSVNIDSYNYNDKSYSGGIVGYGQSAVVSSGIVNCANTGEISGYNNFSKPMAQYVAGIIDSGRGICVGKNEFNHITGLETHPEEEIIVKEATATEDGLKEIYCPTCDKVVRTDVIPATGEPLAEPEEELDEEQEEIVPQEPVEQTPVEEEEEVVETPVEPTTQVHVHSFGVWGIVTSATCTASGSQSRICSGCGESETETIAALGHSFGSWSTTREATCEEAGSQSRTCGRCGETETQIIAALGHSFGSWSTTREATCETAGEEVRSCTNGGCQKTETQTIPAKGHSITYIHEVSDYSYTNNNFTANYIGICNACTDEEGNPTQISSESHSGTYSGYISPDVNNAKCSCGYEFCYSF